MFIVEEHTVRTGREHLNIVVLFVLVNKKWPLDWTGKDIIPWPLCFTKCVDGYWHCSFIPCDCEGSIRHCKCLIVGTRNSGLLKLLMMGMTSTAAMMIPLSVAAMMSWRWRMSLEKQPMQQLSPSQEDFPVQKRRGYLTARTFMWWGEFYHQLRWGEALSALGSVGTAILEDITSYQSHMDGHASAHALNLSCFKLRKVPMSML